MNRYQVSYRLHSKLYYMDLYSDSYQKIRDVFESLCVGEIEEIKKYVFVDNTTIKDDGNYNKYGKLTIKKGENYFQSLTIPKVKKSFVLDESLIRNTFLLNGQKPDIVTFLLHKK